MHAKRTSGWLMVAMLIVGFLPIHTHAGGGPGDNPPGGGHGDRSRNPNPGVVQIDGQAPDGRSYGDLAGDWWNWASQFPFASNPITENGVIDASRGQSGDVWFLAGTFGATAERTCAVPERKSLFFPLSNGLFWFPEDSSTVAGVRAGVNAQINGTTSLECTIDGVALQDLFAYRAQSPAGGFKLRNGPLLADFGYPPGDRDPAVADGYWILLEPLSKGWHEIHFHATLAPSSALDVTYHLLIGAKSSGVAPPNQKYLGKTYGEWNVAWWKWYWSMVHNPYDLHGGGADQNQSGPVWFLMGIYNGPDDQTGSVTVPAGKALFISIINVDCSTIEDPPFHGGNEAELRAQTQHFFDLFDPDSLVFDVDGVFLTNPADYHVIPSDPSESPLFNFTMYHGTPVPNPPAQAVGGGYYVMLKPLPPGEHLIHCYGKSFPIPDFGGFVFEAGGIWKVTVEPDGHGHGPAGP